MKYRRKSLMSLFFLCLLSSCGTSEPTYPLRGKDYRNDLVSVQTAVNLALSAYLKGCVDRSHEISEEKAFNKCKKKASTHIKNDIISIMDQDVKETNSKSQLP